MDNIGSALGGILILLLLLATVVFWVWSLVDAIRADESAYRAGSKLVWVLVIVFTGLLGSVVYWAVGRPRPA